MSPAQAVPFRIQGTAHSYRPDIDGLRALAVIAVIAFHAFPKFARGGFVGVDVFFVISGYLITGIIQSGLADQSFSTPEFYRRRIRRIVPALLPVLVFCLAMGWYVLLPGEFRQLGTHVLSAVGFVSNLVLWNEAGYFDGPSDLKPLLHLWSLGIEEQFYIFWPALLLGAQRFRRNPIIVVVGIALLSLSLDLLLTPRDASAAFFSPLSRAWELALGAWVALKVQGHFRPGPRIALSVIEPQYERLAWLGLLMLVLSVTCLDRGIAYPGWAAILPTVGTALLIATGPGTWVAVQLLSHRTIVGIGLISYPLYLWHWPLLAFLNLCYPEGPPGWLKAVMLASTVLLAVFTYYRIETPARSGRFTIRALLISAVACGLAGALVLLGAIPPVSSRYDLSKITAVNTEPDFPEPFLKRFQFGKQTFFRDGEGTRETIFIGDSTMEESALLIQRLSEERTTTDRSGLLLTKSGCLPIPGVEAERDHKWCGQFSRDAFAYALQSQSDRVVIGANWYAEFQNASETIHLVFRERGRDYPLGSESEGADKARSALQQAVTELVHSGKKVWLVLNAPFGPELSPASLVQRSLWSGFEIRPAALDEKRFRAMTQIVSAPLRKLAAASGAEVIDPCGSLCNDGRCPALTDDGTPIYRDWGHLRPTFMRDHVSYLNVTMQP